MARQPRRLWSDSVRDKQAEPFDHLVAANPAGLPCGSLGFSLPKRSAERQRVGRPCVAKIPIIHRTSLWDSIQGIADFGGDQRGVSKTFCFVCHNSVFTAKYSRRHNVQMACSADTARTSQVRNLFTETTW